MALSSVLTSPHEMAAQRNGARKDGTSGGVLASESGESRHAVGGKMAASWDSTVTYFSLHERRGAKADIFFNSSKPWLGKRNQMELESLSM